MKCAHRFSEGVFCSFYFPFHTKTGKTKYLRYQTDLLSLKESSAKKQSGQVRLKRCFFDSREHFQRCINQMNWVPSANTSQHCWARHNGGDSDLPTHLSSICRQSCSWSCSCHHSSGTGNDLLRQVAQRAGGTEPHTFHYHTTAHPSASSYSTPDAKV